MNKAEKYIANATAEKVRSRGLIKRDGLEEYFINENELKENMAKGWEQIDVDKSTNTYASQNYKVPTCLISYQ